MPAKLLVQSLHIHRQSMSAELFDRLTEENKGIKPWIEDFYDFYFDPLVFTHATLLLRDSAIPYGSDLRHYLAPVREYFEAAEPKVGCIRLNSNNTDFRRRASEEFGVAIASLLMVGLLGVRWETIAQIPANAALTTRRRDFIGFTQVNDSVIFEAKGSTSLKTARDAVADAREQVKDYPAPNGQAALGKFAISSYFPADEVAFPAFSFVADPPFPDVFVPSVEGCIELHVINVLSFVGLPASLHEYVRYLTTHAAARNAPSENQRRKADLEQKAREAYAVYQETRVAEEGQLENYVVAGVPLRGRAFPVEEESGLISFVGFIAQKVMEKPEGISTIIREGNEAANIFPDGTVLGIKSTHSKRKEEK